MKCFSRHVAWFACAIACALPAWGSSLRQLRESAEMSMLVTGSLIVNPDGSLRSYQIEDAAKLPPVVLGLIAKSAAGWRFKPVMQDGHAVAAKATVSMRIVAKPEPSAHYELSIRGAQFGRDAADYAGLVFDDRPPPRYPMEAIHSRTGADVYLALRVDSTGKVADAVATQVNLLAIGPDSLMARMREVFATASAEACKHWTFKIPKNASPPADGYWIVRVPIRYRMGNESGNSKDPAWQAYIPGPLQPVPWLQHDALATSDIDAMPEQGLYDPRGALTLDSSLNHG